MTCNHCGTTFHPQAEMCWNCGHFATLDAEDKYKLRAPSELERISSELSQEFDAIRESHTSDEGGPILFDEDLKRSLVPFNDETESNAALSVEQSHQPEVVKRIIRWLRLLLGEEPEPVVLTPNMRKALTKVLRKSLFPPALALVLVAAAVIARDAGMLCLGLALILLIVGVVASEVVELWKFGKLKRKLREERKGIMERTQSEDGDSNRSYWS